MLRKTDTEIIKLLRLNCRIKPKEMSALTDLPLSTVYEKMTNTGLLVTRFTCLLNHDAFGNTVHAFAVLKVAPKDRFALQKELEICNNVNLLWRINNGSDFVAEFIFPNLFTFEAYKESLESQFAIRNIVLHFMIDEIKRETFIPG